MKFLPELREAFWGYIVLILSFLLNIEFDHNLYLPTILTTNLLILVLSYLFTKKIKNHALLSVAIVASILSMLGQFYFELKIVTLIGNISLSIACFGNILLFCKSSLLKKL